MLDTIWGVLWEDYYDTGKVNTSLMRDNALKAYVDALGDPYTTYLDGSEYAYLVDDLKGEQHFAWIGAVVYKKDAAVVIEEVLKNSPAALAGLRPFDMIVQIDWESVADLTIWEAVEKIRGEKGSTVRLSLLRRVDGGDAQLIEQNIVRWDIVNESVWLKDLDYSGYRFLSIEITSIGEETDTLLTRHLKDVDMSTIDWVILDLRWNAWWFLLAGVDIASRFLPKGSVVVSSHYPAYKDEVFRSTGSWPFLTTPVAVLVDWLTASASEIIALALRDVRNIPIVWEETFWKGSIQTIHEFDKGSLKYTVGFWYSPDGTHLLSWGIVPDISVAFDVTGYSNDRIDTQLQAAQAVLLEQLTKSSDK